MKYLVYRNDFKRVVSATNTGDMRLIERTINGINPNSFLVVNSIPSCETQYWKIDGDEIREMTEEEKSELEEEEKKAAKIASFQGKKIMVSADWDYMVANYNLLLQLAVSQDHILQNWAGFPVNRVGSVMFDEWLTAADGVGSEILDMQDAIRADDNVSVDNISNYQ